MTKDKQALKEEKKRKHKEKVEQRKKEATIVRRIVLVVFFVLIIAIAVAGFSAYRYVMAEIEPEEDEHADEISVSIPIGSTADSIAEILEEEGVIQNGAIFRYYVRFQNEAGFQAGDYALRTDMHFDEIIEELKTGAIHDEYQTIFTIPEGLWLTEIAARVAEETNLETESFLETARDEDYLEELIDRFDMLGEEILQDEIREPLEGYLFPARYDFIEEELTNEQVIEAMLSRMNTVLQNANAFDSEDTIHELLAKASIIEGEARDDDERTIISGVIENRLSIDMRLEMDPTVGYAHGERLSRTLFEDLEIESPYNTYHIRGLPVGPINNPGEASIRAASMPDEHSYLFFYHAPDGEVYFSENFAEHNAIVNQYQ
ncbi:endolytic transglycosylase MltG [Salisediminibacterium selenitireducens]|uniref:Endolytic murein transglycosylase n=1 Tax=Bacillus selenitireducens (strain ATCC 700615 / DSM 15326 / MLS10) TaxID=439292 RepID=D6XWW4_BACIE|nr:endolytic transglycosylase MltG [Salisediminibacterium selenitireducens]ADH99940.1 aminodeoxychorismate lyase [[Bacillus] selenitireducens MLS10]